MYTSVVSSCVSATVHSTTHFDLLCALVCNKYRHVFQDGEDQSEDCDCQH